MVWCFIEAVKTLGTGKRQKNEGNINVSLVSLSLLELTVCTACIQPCSDFVGAAHAGNLPPEFTELALRARAQFSRIMFLLCIYQQSRLTTIQYRYIR